MRPIPIKHRKQIDSNDYFRTCIHNNFKCSGPVEIDHTLIYNRKQVSEMYAYRPCCEFHHRIEKDKMKKNYREYMSIKEKNIRLMKERHL